jgi:hypothetical protein
MENASESAESLFGDLHKPFFNSIDPEADVPWLARARPI